MQNKLLLLLSLLLFTSSCKPILYSLVTKKDVTKDVLVFEDDRGKRLIYIGMTHLGKKGYYESVKTRVDSLRRKGYLVLYEGVEFVENDTILRKFRKVRGGHLTNYHDVENKSMKLSKRISKYEHQDHDNTGVNPKIDINVDYSINSLVYLYEKEYKTIELSDCDWQTPLTAKYKCKDTVKHSKYVMQRRIRDKKVVDMIKQYQDKNIVLIYGYGHRFPIHAGIRDLGYKLVEGKLRAF